MKKKCLSLLLIVLLCIGMIVPAAAADLPFVVDDAGVLTEEEVSEFNDFFAKLSNWKNADIVALIIESVADYGYEELEEFADDVYDSYDFGRGEDYDGVILCIAVEDDDWYLASFGGCSEKMDSEILSQVGEEVELFCDDGDYNDALMAYAVDCNAYLPDVDAADDGSAEYLEDGEYVYVIDEAALLSEDAYWELDGILSEISDKHNVDVVVVTVDDYYDYGCSDPEDFACWAFETVDYGRGINDSGVILILSMAERDWYIAGFGDCETSINNDAIEMIGDAVVPYLSDGDYLGGFSRYAQLCDTLMTSAANGDVYKTPMNWPVVIMSSVVVGLALAGIVVGMMKRKLKSVAMQRSAANYVVDGSMHVTRANERYLYSSVVSRPKPEKSSSSSSGGGRSHSGGGGKF